MGYIKVYVGSSSDFENLSLDEKVSYDEAHFTDDDGAIPSDVYSTTETKTNKVWIDGKPIYRKCFVRTDTDAFEIVPNLSEVLSVSGMMFYKNGAIVPLLYPSYDGQNNNVVSCYINTSKYLTPQFGANAVSGLNKAYFIIEYTKTTD